MEPLVPPTTVCKCCQAPARLFGVCDLSKNCEERNGLLLKLTGIPVPYYRCSGWYIAPRNGHISIHTRQSLQTVLERFGLQLASADQSIHCAYRQIPDFARHLFTKS